MIYIVIDAVLPLWEHTNAFLQKAEPLIHVLKDVMVKLLMKIMTKFIKQECIKGPDLASLRSVDYHDEHNHKPNQQLFIGQRTRSYVTEHGDELQTE